ncbi:MAG: DNA-binding protein [Anaerolineaceae bacterium]|nr:DNA-binding protein [Anaerolineaceae bacterium]
MTQAIVTPELLRWARGRAEVALEEVAKSANVSPEKVASWEQGESYPTLRQARKIANKLKIPFGYLYLSNPPEDKIPLPDFRKPSHFNIQSISLELHTLIQDTLRKQEWYREYLLSEGESRLHFVGQYGMSNDPSIVATSIGEIVEINHDLRRQAHSWSDFLRLIVLKSEKARILVLRTGVVQNNNNRPLNPDEFRGFAISDDIAPLVLINSKDAIAAQVFTLAHELAHLWLGRSGISNYDIIDTLVTQPLNRDIEDYCNQVATELLVPKESFLNFWSSQNNALSNLSQIAREYWVSTIVILRRALDLEIIDREQFFTHYRQEIEKQTDVTARSSEGGHFYNTFYARHSKQLTEGIVNATLEGNLLYRDAASLLGVKVSTIQKLAENLESV